MHGKRKPRQPACIGVASFEQGCAVGEGTRHLREKGPFVVNRIGEHFRGNVVAYVALFFALGGSAYAVTALDRNSVRSKHIVNGQVKTPDLANGAVTEEKLANGVVNTTLRSGETLSGSWGARGGAEDSTYESIQFRIPLAAPITGANTHVLEPGAPPTVTCPGVGEAAPGHLCIYEREADGNPAGGSIFHHESGPKQLGAGRFGFVMFYGSLEPFFISGNWAVSAP